jgi:hypothetical protein
MSSARASVLLLSTLLRDLLAQGRKHLGPTQSLLALLLVGLVLRGLLALHLLVRDRCVVACLHLQRRTMLLLAPTILSRRSLLLRQLMRSHSRLCINSSSSHPSLLVSRTPTMGLMLAVCLPHLPHHLLVSVVRQAKGRHRLLFLLIASVLVALLLKCAPSWRTEQHPHVTDIRALTSITLTLHLVVVSLAVLLLRRQLKLLPSRRPAIVMSALRQHHQRDIANGKKMTTLARSPLRMMRSAKRSKSLTAVALHPRTACRRLRCRVRVHRMVLTLDDSMMATIHPRLLTTHPRSLLWLLHDHCLACRRHRSLSALSITNPLLATWMWMRITMMREMRRSPVLRNLSEAARVLHPLMVLLMRPLLLSKSRKYYE